MSSEAIEREEWIVRNPYVSARFVGLPGGKWRAIDVPPEIRQVLEESEPFHEVVEAPDGLIADSWRPARLLDHSLGMVLARFQAMGFTVEKVGTGADGALPAADDDAEAFERRQREHWDAALTLEIMPEGWEPPATLQTPGTTKGPSGDLSTGRRKPRSPAPPKKGAGGVRP